MKLLYVPAGNFKMGSTGAQLAKLEKICMDIGGQTQIECLAAYADETPQHAVYLDAFWIDQTEVTNAMYAKCVADGACDPPQKAQSATHTSYYGSSQFAAYPVIYVDWSQADAYGKKRSAARTGALIPGVKKSIQTRPITTRMLATGPKWAVTRQAPALTGRWIWPAMCGNGRRTGTTKVIIGTPPPGATPPGRIPERSAPCAAAAGREMKLLRLP